MPVLGRLSMGIEAEQEAEQIMRNINSEFETIEATLSSDKFKKKITKESFFKRCARR